MIRMDWVSKFAIILPALFLFFSTSSSTAQNDNNPFSTEWTPNGVIKAIVYTPDATYIGGSFNCIGRCLGHAATFDVVTGRAAPVFPNTDMFDVFSSSPDGWGGWYFGGDFTKVGGSTRRGIAHVLSDGSLDASWNPDVNGNVLSIVVSGPTVYIGGEFTQVGGLTRNHIAAIDALSGIVAPWNPNADHTIHSLCVSGSTLYVGGEFSTIGGQPRNSIAALDIVTGEASSWDPATSSTITSIQVLALSNSIIVVGGEFTSIGGQPRNNLAALDLSTGNATPWNPTSGIVYSLAISDTTIYSGGEQHLKAYDIITGAPTSWNPNPTLPTGFYPEIHAMALSESDPIIYVGGLFTSIGGKSTQFLAALDQTTGEAVSWDPVVDEAINTLAVAGSTIFAGGRFKTVNALRRPGLASLDPQTGVPTSWIPSAGFAVTAMDVSNSKVYVAGGFEPTRISRIDASTGATDWSVNVQLLGLINAMDVYGGLLFVGGEFTEINGTQRNNLAALDPETGAVTSWNPNATGGNPLTTINAITYSSSNNQVYVGGNFTNVGGKSRNYISALDPISGAASSWNPNLNGPSPNFGTVNALLSLGSTLYLGGSFTTIGGTSRNHIAAIDGVTGALSFWNPDSNGPIYALSRSGSSIYSGGAFTIIGGQLRHNIAALDTEWGEATPWNPDINYWINSIAASDTTVYVGGSFTSIGELPIHYFAQFGPPPAAAPNWKNYH